MLAMPVRILRMVRKPCAPLPLLVLPQLSLVRRSAPQRAAVSSCVFFRA